MTERQELQKVAFLDTNTLHYIGLCLNYAKEKHLFPFGPEGVPGKKDEAIEEVGNSSETEELKRRLKQGLQAVDFLATQDIQVEYAPVSEIELLNGRARGKAILSMAAEGVPERMWSRINEEEIRERVGLEELAEVRNGINELTVLLQASGITVRAYDAGRTRDALELTKGINGLVFMELVDSLIYASAVLAGSDYLITSDSYFKDTVNLIHRAEDERYATINKRLKNLVSQLTLEPADTVELPTAHSMTAAGQWHPPLPLSTN